MNSRVFPVLKWSSQKRWRTLEPVHVNDGWLTAEIIHKLAREADGRLTLELFSGWIPDGNVYWDSVEVRELPEYAPPEPRVVRTAVVDSRPRKPVTLMENCDFYVSLIAKMCQMEKLDVICLTEKFNQLDVKNKSTIALTMDGKYMSRIVNAQAQVVASSNRRPYIAVTVELDKPIAHWGGSEFSHEYFTNRRPELYGILSDDSLRVRIPDGPILIPDPEL